MNRLIAFGTLVFGFVLETLAVTVNTQVFHNPILPGFYSDPTACRGPNGTFCLAASSLQFFPIIPLFESTDLVHWTLKGHAITEPGVSPLGSEEIEYAGFFAPTLRYWNGLFYLCVSSCAPRADGTTQGAVVMTAPRLEGPWTKPVSVDWKGQWFGDPSLDFHADGKCYFTATTGRTILLAEFDPVALKLKEAPREVWSGTGAIYPEGPHVYKRGEWYYLLLAEGGTEYGHQESIARSKCVYGPYESCPHNPIATHARLFAQGSKLQAIGHGDFVEDDAGNAFFICHATRPQFGMHHLLGRETVCAPAKWVDGWPVVNDGKAIADTPQNTETLPAWDWTWICNPSLADYAIDEKAKTVTLTPSGVKLTDVGSPTFVGTRQVRIEDEFSARLLAQPSAGAQTGVAAYMGRSHHYALVFERSGASCRAFVRYRLGTMEFKSESVEVTSFPAKIRVAASAKSYDFFVNGQRVATADARHISCETNSDSPYNGVVFGFFAEGDPATGKVRFGY